MSSTTELDELHELIGGLRRCVTSLASKYGDSPAMRRIVNDAERILNDSTARHRRRGTRVRPRYQATTTISGEKIAIPDTQYDSDFWRDVDDEVSGDAHAARLIPPPGNRPTLRQMKATVSAPTADRQGDRRLLADPRPDRATHAAHRPVVAVTADHRPRLGRLRRSTRRSARSCRPLLRRGLPLPDAVLLAVPEHRVRARGRATSGHVPRRCRDHPARGRCRCRSCSASG